MTGELLDLEFHKEIDRVVGRHIAVKHQEARRLAWLGAQVPAGGTLVECGSFWGRSGAYLLSGALSAPGDHALTMLVCIDRWKNDADYDKFRQNMGDLKILPWVKPIRSISWEADFAEPIDLLFLDSTHTYAVLEREWAKFFTLVRPGGIVVFHDYSASVWPDVKRFVDRVAQKVLQPTGVIGTVWSGVKA